MQHLSSATSSRVLRHALSSLALAAAGLGVSGSAQAFAFVSTPDVILSYNVQLDDGVPGVTNIIKFNTYLNGSGAAWPDSVPAGSSTMVDVFAKSALNPPLQAFIVGITHDLPGDAEGQQHVVLFMNDIAASNSANISWGTLFSNTSEAQLLNNIVRGTTIENDDEDLDKVGAFAFGDAMNGHLGTGGTNGSAWFNIGSTFKVVAFSDGKVIGSGQSIATPVANVPEPQAYALSFSGLAVVGLIARRRRSRVQA